jgi:hypothetical protein
MESKSTIEAKSPNARPLIGILAFGKLEMVNHLGNTEPSSISSRGFFRANPSESFHCKNSRRLLVSFQLFSLLTQAISFREFQ